MHPDQIQAETREGPGRQSHEEHRLRWIGRDRLRTGQRHPKDLGGADSLNLPQFSRP